MAKQLSSSSKPTAGPDGSTKPLPRGPHTVQLLFHFAVHSVLILLSCLILPAHLLSRSSEAEPKPDILSSTKLLFSLSDSPENVAQWSRIVWGVVQAVGLAQAWAMIRLRKWWDLGRAIEKGDRAQAREVTNRGWMKGAEVSIGLSDVAATLPSVRRTDFVRPLPLHLASHGNLNQPARSSSFDTSCIGPSRSPCYFVSDQTTNVWEMSELTSLPSSNPTSTGSSLLPFSSPFYWLSSSISLWRTYPLLSSAPLRCSPSLHQQRRQLQPAAASIQTSKVLVLSSSLSPSSSHSLQASWLQLVSHSIMKRLGSNGLFREL